MLAYLHMHPLQYNTIPHQLTHIPTPTPTTPTHTHTQWWNAPHGQEVKERAAAEEYARDSFENLLYSICRFKARHAP